MIPEKAATFARTTLRTAGSGRWKAGETPRVSTRYGFALSVESEQADAGRDDQTCLTKSNYKARAGTGEKTFHTFVPRVARYD